MDVMVKAKWHQTSRTWGTFRTLCCWSCLNLDTFQRVIIPWVNPWSKLAEIYRKVINPVPQLLNWLHPHCVVHCVVLCINLLSHPFYGVFNIRGMGVLWPCSGYPAVTDPSSFCGNTASGPSENAAQTKAEATRMPKNRKTKPKLASNPCSSDEYATWVTWATWVFYCWQSHLDMEHGTFTSISPSHHLPKNTWNRMISRCMDPGGPGGTGVFNWESKFFVRSSTVVWRETYGKPLFCHQV